MTLPTVPRYTRGSSVNIRFVGRCMDEHVDNGTAAHNPNPVISQRRRVATGETAVVSCVLNLGGLKILINASTLRAVSYSDLCVKVHAIEGSH
jgi:hypothetical protein